MGGSALPCRALIGLCVLVIGAGGLRLIRQGEDCSQPEINCTIKSSSCFDFNWLRSFKWTPNAPSRMEVTVGIGQNDLGQTVPLLHINWSISVDASILQLQGVKISVLEVSTQKELCVQFQFNNTFDSQVNPNRQPWQFYYNNFEVSPGHRYYVTVQHLPKQEQVNHKSQEFTVPCKTRLVRLDSPAHFSSSVTRLSSLSLSAGCDESHMMQTDTCCKLGLCWYPNIRIKHRGENLTVEFSSRWDAHEYGVQVKVSDVQMRGFQKVLIQEGPPVQRVQVTFPHIGGFVDKECVYNISVWPYMPPCGNDCVRQYYVPLCATEAPPPPEPFERWYFWSVAVLLIIALFGGIILALHPKDCCKDPEKFNRSPPSSSKPVRKRVWMVYSADNEYYLNVVIKLADFMKRAWGLEVVLDRLHVQEMGTIGPMAWLGHQKNEIERTKGTILILCSKGAQEKWKAMQDVEQQVTLREDREHPIGDLFTPALSLILPDFQMGLPYDRYVVAYFGTISTLMDIPSTLEVCPKYCLTENLQDVFFRIQRQEQHQPHVQLTVSQEEHPSYRHLVKAMERCKEWQERNVDWFENECLMKPVEVLENTEEEEDVADDGTRKVYPLIRRPETSVSLVMPLILEPEPAKVLDPTIMIGAPSTEVEPFLSDINPSVSVIQPLLQDVTSAVVYLQEPHLVGEDPLQVSRGPLRQEVSIQSDQSVMSMEQLREAQASIFQNFLESSDMSPAVEFMDAPCQDLVLPNLGVAGDQPGGVGEQFHEIFLGGQLLTPAVDPGTGPPDGHSVQLTDQGYSSWDPHEMDLKAIRMESLKLFLQNEGVLLNTEQV